MNEVFLGTIKIENVEVKGDRFIRLTIDSDPFLRPQLDQLEAEGSTLTEALFHLYQLVEEMPE